MSHVRCVQVGAVAVSKSPGGANSRLHRPCPHLCSYLKAWSALEKRRGRMEEARALLTAATDLAPQDATAWLLR